MTTPERGLLLAIARFLLHKGEYERGLREAANELLAEDHNRPSTDRIYESVDAYNERVA